MTGQAKKYKIAICLRGLATGESKRSSVRGFEGWPSIVRHIIQDHDVDVFCHSWSVDAKERIINTYNPRTYLIEEQIIFDEHYSKEQDGNKNTKNLWSPHVALSQLYSLCKGIEMKSRYEKKLEFKYDYVFCLRYDMHFLDDFDYSILEREKYQGTLIHSRSTWQKKQHWELRPELRKERFPYLDRWINDLYWCSDSDTINRLGTVFEVLRELQHRPYSIHKTWDLFFKTISFPEENLIEYPSSLKMICTLTRSNWKVKPDILIGDFKEEQAHSIQDQYPNNERIKWSDVKWQKLKFIL